MKFEDAKKTMNMSRIYDEKAHGKAGDVGHVQDPENVIGTGVATGNVIVIVVIGQTEMKTDIEIHDEIDGQGHPSTLDKGQYEELR